MSPQNPLRSSSINEFSREILLTPDSIDFLSGRLPEVARTCLLSSLPADKYLELYGGKISPSHTLMCNLELSDNRITDGSLRVVSQQSGVGAVTSRSQPPLSFTRSKIDGFWNLMLPGDDKPVTNAAIVRILRTANPELFPAYASPLGEEVTDTALFNLLSDQVTSFKRKIATKVFTVIDARGFADYLSIRHNRLVYSQTTETTSSTKKRPNTSTSIYMDRWAASPLIDAPVDVGYQLVYSAIGRRSEALSGRIVCQSTSGFLKELEKSDHLPHPKDFAADMTELLDKLEEQAGRATYHASQKW